MSDELPEAVSPVVGETTSYPIGNRQLVAARIRKPFALGFALVAGGLSAYLIAGALASLSTVLVSIAVALFIAMALEPMVAALERRRLSRGLAIAIVFGGFALIGIALLAVVIPIAVVQIGEFAQSVPDIVADVQRSGWLQRLVGLSGQSAFYDTILDQVRGWLSDPTNLLALSGGALAVGSGVVNGAVGTLIVLVLTLYFLASLRSMKAAVVRVTPAHSRVQVSRITNQLTDAVGGYISGMAILAVINATFSLILLLVLRVPFAPLLAALALFITMIPMVGPALFWVVASVVSLLTIGWAGLIFVGVYFGYMQVEAYLMTPKVMTKAVSIPGSLVLIGAMVGGTLLGLLGALVAVPVTASLLMILDEVFIPRQDAKLSPG